MKAKDIKVLTEAAKKLADDFKDQIGETLNNIELSDDDYGPTINAYEFLKVEVIRFLKT